MSAAPSTAAAPTLSQLPRKLLFNVYAPEAASAYNKLAFEKNGMQYCRLGVTGVVVSRIALGLMTYAAEQAGDEKQQEWVLGNDDADALLKQALDAGINFFDTAEVYSEGRSETWLGRALKKLLTTDATFTRKDLVIMTKINPPRTPNPNSKFGGLQKGLSRKAIFDAVEDSLARLQTDYIDVYFIHRFDPNTAVEETMHALHDLVVAGKIRYIGASSMFVWQFNLLQQAAERNGWTKFTVMQNHYNAIYREEEREMIPYCISSGVACLPWSPLASGVLCRAPTDAGDTHRAATDKAHQNLYGKQSDDEVRLAVQAIAKQRGIPAAQVALAWLLSKRAITAPIIGATKPNQISDAVAALQIKLTEEEIESIEKEYLPHAVSGHA